jgi:hypothetical protein
MARKYQAGLHYQTRRNYKRANLDAKGIPFYVPSCFTTFSNMTIIAWASSLRTIKES